MALTLYTIAQSISFAAGSPGWSIPSHPIPFSSHTYTYTYIQYNTVGTYLLTYLLTLRTSSHPPIHPSSTPSTHPSGFRHISLFVWRRQFRFGLPLRPLPTPFDIRPPGHPWTAPRPAIIPHIPTYIHIIIIITSALPPTCCLHTCL